MEILECSVETGCGCARRGPGGSSLRDPLNPDPFLPGLCRRAQALVHEGREDGRASRGGADCRHGAGHLPGSVWVGCFLERQSSHSTAGARESVTSASLQTKTSTCIKSVSFHIFRLNKYVLGHVANCFHKNFAYRSIAMPKNRMKRFTAKEFWSRAPHLCRGVLQTPVPGLRRAADSHHAIRARADHARGASSRCCSKKGVRLTQL